jgi:LemA protein
MITWIILGVIAVAVLWLVATYNSFVRLVTRSEEAWADIDVQLKRRYDLIPNLLEAVKGYMTHEAGTLQKVTEARNMAMTAGSVKEKGEAENMLSSTLKSIFALSENYPDLKANTNFLDLQNELTDTENKIQASRRFYNTNVRDLNIAVKTFPKTLIANWFNFSGKEFFALEADSVEREPVKVKF